MRLNETYYVQTYHKMKKTYLVECQGKRIDEHCAVIRAWFVSNETYNVIHIASGLKVCGDYKTIKAAVEDYNLNFKKTIENPEEYLKEKIDAAIKAFNTLYEEEKFY